MYMVYCFWGPRIPSKASPRSPDTTSRAQKRSPRAIPNDSRVGQISTTKIKNESKLQARCRSGESYPNRSRWWGPLGSLTGVMTTLPQASFVCAMDLGLLSFSIAFLCDTVVLRTVVGLWPVFNVDFRGGSGGRQPAVRPKSGPEGRCWNGARPIVVT